MYNKNGCGQGCGLFIGTWHVGVVIMVPETISKKLRPIIWIWQVHCLHECIINVQAKGTISEKRSE